MSNRMLMHKATSLKQTKTGFSLLEVLITITIVSIISAYAIPTYRRNLSQGHVDRYTQFLKTGLFSLDQGWQKQNKSAASISIKI